MTKIAAAIVNVQREEKRSCDAFEADVRKTLKGLLHGKGRAGLAKALTNVMGREITKMMVDNWVAEGKCQPRLPLSVAKALSELIEDPSLSRYLNTEEELALIKIGEHARANKDLVARIASPPVKRSNRKK